VSETWHGIVHSVEASGIYLTIPRLLGREVLGPALTAVPNLAAGDRVVGAKIGDLQSDLIILARATGPDYATEAFVNAAGTADATPSTIMRRDATGSTVVEDIYLNSSATEPNRAVAKAELDAGLSTKAPVVHTHPWTDVTDKPATFTPSAHTHLWADLTDKPATFAPSAHTHDWTTGVTGKPSTFAPSAHTHPWTDVTGKPATFAPSAHRHPWSDLDNVPATFAPMAHVHPSTDISDSTSIGRGLLIAQTAATARTVIGAMDAARTFTKADVGLGSVDNTADVDKPISALTQAALNLKSDTGHTHAIADVTGLQTALDDAGAGAWVTLTMSGAWVAYTGGGNYYQGLRARRNGNNVQIQGMVKNGAIGVIASLPLELTPLYTSLQTVVAGNATSTRTVAYLVISGKGGPNGTVPGGITYDSGISAPTFVDINLELPLTDG
jgi:hypothetical protein